MSNGKPLAVKPASARNLTTKLASRVDSSRNPLFQVSFALQNTPASPLMLRDTSVAPFHASVDSERRQSQ